MGGCRLCCLAWVPWFRGYPYYTAPKNGYPERYALGVKDVKLEKVERFLVTSGKIRLF